MAELDLDLYLDRIQIAITTERLEDGASILMELHPVDRAEIFNRLDSEQRSLLVPLLDVQATADLFVELEAEDTLEAATALSTERLADVLDVMEPDEAADLLGDLPPDQVTEALAQMEDAAEVLPLLGYPDETAGGLMTTSFIALRRQTSAAQAIDFLREVAPEIEIPYYLYVVDREKHLIGVVGLRELLVARPTTTMESIMDREVYYVSVGTDQEEVAQVMARYDLAAVPVVDEELRLVGVITHDDIVDVIEEEVTEDILHLGAVDSGPLGERQYWTQRVFDVVRSRFLWLLILFVTQTLTGNVIRAFQEELEAVVSLTFFIPLLIGTGGNAGSQTVATVIRALALRELRPRDALKVWLKEVQTAFLLGLLIGIVALIWSFIWGVDQYIAITVAVTVTMIVVWANSVASLVPLFASAVGIDPTIVSGPLMTTLIDATGLLIYFTLAAWIIPQL